MYTDWLKKYIITWTFQQHLNAGGASAVYPGIDFGMAISTPLYAIEDGYLQFDTDSYGANYVMLTSNTGTWFYVHLDRFYGKGNRNVKAGDLLGYSGNTGYSFGPHLHLGLQVKGKYIDPYSYLFNNSNMEQKKAIANTSQYPSLSLIARDLFKYPDWNKKSAWDRILSSNVQLKTGDYNFIPKNAPIYAPSEQVEQSVQVADKNIKALEKQLKEAQEEAKKKELELTEKFTKEIEEREKELRVSIGQLELELQEERAKLEGLRSYKALNLNIELTEQEEAVIEEFKGNIAQRLVIGFSNLIDKFPKWVRPSIYLAISLGLVSIIVPVISQESLDIFINNLILNNPQSPWVGVLTFISSIGIANTVASIVNQVGNKLRERVVE